jgi:type 1 fimbriae regulatory protein FimB
MWAQQLKGGLSTHQPLAADENEALSAYLTSRSDCEPWHFLSSQGGKMTRQNFHYLVGQAGERAGLDHAHPHQLCHSCGYTLANRGADTRLVQDWSGHRDMRHTASCTRTAAARFRGLWEQLRKPPTVRRAGVVSGFITTRVLWTTLGVTCP